MRKVRLVSCGVLLFGALFIPKAFAKSGCIYVTEDGRPHCAQKQSMDTSSCDKAVGTMSINGKKVIKAFSASIYKPPRSGAEVCEGGGYTLPY